MISVDCQWSNWAEYSMCSKTCGGGMQTRKRHKVIRESNGGLCFGFNENTITCNTQNCPSLVCQWSTWSSFSPCSKSCGSGAKQRIRHKLIQESNGGVCHGSNENTIPCGTEKCPGKSCCQCHFRLSSKVGAYSSLIILGRLAIHFYCLEIGLYFIKRAGPAERIRT